MRRLAPSHQEALRKRVMGAIEDRMTTAEAVRVFGVSRDSTRNRKLCSAAVGVAGMVSVRPGRSGLVKAACWPDGTLQNCRNPKVGDLEAVRLRTRWFPNQ
ncbi:hypothetical protein [Glycomyces salinus]|uniref:hypothetical protein n=1 Tax=Glycomyces salinus TaxID=980294 RepID=UPI0018EC6350|nr:hypothetical protein [Glycomyces salinus]